MDCGSQLKGKYCHQCGQRRQRRTASIFSLIGELISGLFNWDSRMWRTLWPLFAKPGHLTKAFMEGKRERYIPPVRLYLVSSIIFFLLVSMSPRNLLSEISDVINFKMGGVGTGLEQGLDTKINSESLIAVARVVSEADGVWGFKASQDSESTDENVDDETAVSLDERDVIAADPESDIPDVSKTESTPSDIDPSATMDASSTTATEQEGDATDINLDGVEIAMECEEIKSQDFSPRAEFLRLPAYRFCLSVSTWRGFLAFMSALVDSLPKTLLILIPLMALVNKFLYLFARRFYVEHLLYYVHNYSFLFLFSVSVAGLIKLSNYAGIGISGYLMPLSFLYVVFYFFRSMRVVYAQGFFLTLAKWILLVLAFFFMATVVLLFFTLATAAVHGL